ncbi:hypothetical protein AB9F26_05165 [Falsihalocynthiibacter sp. BN13B15]|uniref:hypothetical protein n=1 Tax=Falsihalocynthiibacter sp. BN13B15 TaxID=3240871 RepID=UPI0035107C9A
MTVEQAFPFQVWIAEQVALALAADPIEVFDYAPQKPPVEFIRLDGFGLTGQSLKNKERGRHSCEIHYFHRPKGADLGARGQKRAKEVLAGIHSFLKVQAFLGETLSFQSMSNEKDADGVTQHGHLRYSILIS